MHNLKHKIVKGGLFLSITNVFNQLIAIVINVILARLLLADDFGIIALSTTYIGFVSIFLSIGFGSSIIHYNDANKSQISSLYYLNFFIAIVTFLFVFLTASFAAIFYKEPDLESIIKWSSLSILITPFFITHLKIFERNLDFKKIGLIVVVASFLSGILAVFAVLNGFGVYSLVIQSVSMTVFKLVLVRYYSGWNPNCEFNFSNVRHMVIYSIKYRLSMGALYIERNIDYIILGKIFSPVILGYYAFAYNIMYTPVKRISNMFKDILFPSFSSIKNDKEKIIKGYLKSLQIIAFIVFPGMILLSLNAEWLIIKIFGNQWEGAIPIVKILCFAGAFQSVSQFGDVIFDSIGKPHISLFLAIIRSVLIVSAIILGGKFGIIYTAYFIVVIKIISFLIILILIYTQINFNIFYLWKYLKGTIFTVIIIYISQILIYDFLKDSFFKLFIQSLIVCICIFSFYRHDLVDIKNKIKSKH